MITFLPAPQTLAGSLNQVCIDAVSAAVLARAPFCHLCSSSSHVAEQRTDLAVFRQFIFHYYH